MATPRKHWFRVADSLTVEPLSNDELATLIRLMGHLNQRWARDGLTATEACSTTLRRLDAMTLTTRTSYARALRVLHACATRVSLTVRECDAGVQIEWPKWKEFQGLSDPVMPEVREKVSRESPPPQDAPSPAPSPAPRESKNVGKSPTAKTRATPKKVPKPERFEGETRDRIIAWAQRRFPGNWARILDDGYKIWEGWGPTKGFMRPISSWEGSFKGIVNGSLAEGRIKLETDDEKYRRELEGSPIVRAVGGADGE